jgi:uncharacterized protein (DUF1778 family)
MQPRSARAKRQTRSEKLDLRLTARDKRILQEAATAERRSVTEFVLHSALTRAEDVLADQRLIGLNAQQWKAFIEALDAPPQRHARLEKLLKEPSVFD